MDPRKIARIVGVLFIAAIVAGIILDDPDYLDNVPVNENQVLTGTPFEFTLAIAVAVMLFLMYPILKKHNVSLSAICLLVYPCSTKACISFTSSDVY